MPPLDITCDHVLDNALVRYPGDVLERFRDTPEVRDLAYANAAFAELVAMAPEQDREDLALVAARMPHASADALGSAIAALGTPG